MISIINVVVGSILLLIVFILFISSLADFSFLMTGLCVAALVVVGVLNFSDSQNVFSTARIISLLFFALCFTFSGLFTYKMFAQGRSNSVYVNRSMELFSEIKLTKEQAMKNIFQHDITKKQIMKAKGFTKDEQYESFYQSILEKNKTDKGLYFDAYNVSFYPDQNSWYGLILQDSCNMDTFQGNPGFVHFAQMDSTGNLQPVCSIEVNDFELVKAADERYKEYKASQDVSKIPEIPEPLIYGVNMITGEVLTQKPIDLKEFYNYKSLRP